MKQFQCNVLALAAMTAVALAGTSAYAGGVTGSGGTQVSNVGATPVVNINAANAAGISRNTFSNFDVDKNGVVFNNMLADGRSQLVGALKENGNLKGRQASVIVADINSAQASKINGPMEVAGVPAHLLIANAAGISCNGCNTINAPMVTLAAARFAPRADSPLALEVDTSRATPAMLEIDGDGMDAGAGQLNLLSRATKINAIVKGWKIDSITGSSFDGDANGNFQGKLVRDVANAPQVALDVSALGGMYANKIMLEGSERGLGVNNAGVIQAGKGGLAVELFGGKLKNEAGASASGEVMYTVWTNPANELNSFMSDRRSMRDLVAMTASMRGTDKMDGWSNARKLQELNTVFTNAPKPGGAAVAPTPTEPSQADEQARAEAEARARAEEKARAEEARIAAEQKAREEAARLAADEKARAEAAFNPASYEAELAAQAAWLKANEQARAEQQARRDAEYFAQQEANARYLADKLANYGVQQPAAPTMKMGYSY